MPAKKQTARKRATRTALASSSAITAQDKFTGLSGIWKSVAQFGLSGVVAATMMYSVLYVQPQQLKEFMQATDKQRESGFSHGEKIADGIIDGVKELGNKVEKVGDKFGTVQGVTQTNQRELISTQQRTNELLEKHVIASETGGVLDDGGGWVPVKPKASKRP